MAQAPAKTALHPLKRKSVKPSSSTVRGMLPGRQFRTLDAAMQSLRAAGLRLEWQWKDREIGWVCLGLMDDMALCELHPTKDPLVGQICLTRAQQKQALAARSVSAPFKAVLKIPILEDKSSVTYEFELMTTQERDLFSEFVEALQAVFGTEQV